MIVRFFIYSASTGAPLSGVVASFNYYRRRNDDGTITDLADPAITENPAGSGAYEFTIPDSDLSSGSIIDYVIDCTAAATARYLEDHIDADAVAAEQSEQTGDGVLLFGVTPSSVRRHCFPRLNSFSATTSPTEETVTEKIEVAAARVAAALSAEEISPSSILTNTPEYAICADIVRKLTALSLRIPCDDPSVPEAWQKEVDAFFKLLGENAGAALANPDLVAADSEPDGPTHHIDEYSLSIGDTADASSAEPALRRDDAL